MEEKEEYSNTSPVFKTYLEDSKNENLLLRYSDLVSFVLKSKTEKLTDLSSIIGFEEISEIKKDLKSVSNSLNNKLRNTNYDNSISNEQEIIIKQLGENIVSKEQLLSKFNELLNSSGKDLIIKKYEDIDETIKLLSSSKVDPIVEEIKALSEIKKLASDLQKEVKTLDRDYIKYHKQAIAFQENIEMMKQLSFNNLLQAGKNILEKKFYTESNCPLCTQSTDIQELLSNINKRLEEIQKIEEEREVFDDDKKSMQDMLIGMVHRIRTPSENLEKITIDVKNTLRAKLNSIHDYLKSYQEELEKKIFKNEEMKAVQDLKIDEATFKEIIQICQEKLNTLDDQKKTNETEVILKIEFSKNSYNKIEQLKKERDSIDNQSKTFNILYKEFIKTQKDGIQTFLNRFSQEIDEYFNCIIPDNRIKNISLKEIERDDDLIGLTLEFDFFNKKVSPFQKYLSESYLNAFGLVFFLASVKAFNKNNKFFVLDDIISSFDGNHRKRFSDLLIEKFSDYQIIIFTHERSWFEMFRNLVKNKNWLIKEIKWDSQDGTYIDKPIPQLRKKIEEKLDNMDTDDLGNNIRKYLESTLKKYAEGLEVKVKFLFNERNEARMCGELLSDLKSKIKKTSDNKFSCNPIDRLINSFAILNKDSHDNSNKSTIGDLQAFWDDIISLESLFNCKECSTDISLKYYDSGAKRIRCKCNKLSYAWKN